MCCISVSQTVKNNNKDAQCSVVLCRIKASQSFGRHAMINNSDALLQTENRGCHIIIVTVKHSYKTMFQQQAILY